LRLDPLLYRSLLKPPVGADLETGQFAARGVLVDRERFHAQVTGQFLNGKEAIAVFQKNLLLICFYLFRFISGSVYCKNFTDVFLLR